MYCEESYLQYKLFQINKSRILISEPKIVHLEGKSANKITTDIIHKETSFSLIQNNLSRVIYFRKTGCSGRKIFLIKLFTTLLWINQFIIKTNIKYITKLWIKTKYKT